MPVGETGGLPPRLGRPLSSIARIFRSRVVATTLERKMRAMEDSGRPSLGGNPPVSPTGITGEVTVWCEQR